MDIQAGKDNSMGFNSALMLLTLAFSLTLYSFKLPKSSQFVGFLMVSRIGGEEFAVLLVNTDRQGAEQVAENIRAGVQQLAVTGWTDIHGAITTSIGCAEISENLDLDTVLSRADKALYQAKSAGRNCVRFSA